MRNPWVGHVVVAAAEAQHDRVLVQVVAHLEAVRVESLKERDNVHLARQVHGADRHVFGLALPLALFLGHGLRDRLRDVGRIDRSRRPRQARGRPGEARRRPAQKVFARREKATAQHVILGRRRKIMVCHKLCWDLHPIQTPIQIKSQSLPIYIITGPAAFHIIRDADWLVQSTPGAGRQHGAASSSSSPYSYVYTCSGIMIPSCIGRSVV